MYATLLAREPGGLFVGRFKCTGPHREGESRSRVMHGDEKSDSAVVALKLANKADDRCGAHGAKGGGRGERGTGRHAPDAEPGRHVPRTGPRTDSRKAEMKKVRFTALLHHVDVDQLRAAYALAQAGCGFWRGWRDVARLRPRSRGNARRPSRPSASRSLSGATITAPIHPEAGWKKAPARHRGAGGQDRPARARRGAERDLRGRLPRVLVWVPPRTRPARCAGCASGRDRPHKVNWMLDADIAGFFDAVSHEWLIRFVEHRIGDRRVIRLIRKWLKAGVTEDGQVEPTEIGTPQGAVISPLLANIYLHYVFDLWAATMASSRHAQGDVIIVRYADDIVVGFEHKADAERFLSGPDANGWRVCADAASGKNAPHRVRPPRGGGSRSGAGRASRRLSTSWASRISADAPGAAASSFGGSRGAIACAPSSLALKEELRRRRHLPIPDQGSMASPRRHRSTSLITPCPPTSRP